MAKKRKPGRPRKLAQKPPRRIVLDALRDGCSRHDACVLAGISEQTLRNEEKRDAAFAQDVARKEIEGKRQWIKDVAGKDPKFLLERKYWEEFGRRSPEQLSLANVLTIIGPVINKLLLRIPPEQQPVASDEVEMMLERLDIEAKKR